jgi:hypothetical protein
MSTLSAVDPAALVSPVVLALEQLEEQERALAAQSEDARRTATEAAKRALDFEARLAQARQLRDELRKLAGSHAPRRTRATPPPVVATHEGPMLRGHAGASAAATRELVVLRLIATGLTQTSALRAAIAVPHGLTAEQHRASVSNALSRLKTVRGFISNAGEGWALTAKGRKHLAAVKEEP